MIKKIKHWLFVEVAVGGLALSLILVNSAYSKTLRSNTNLRSVTKPVKNNEFQIFRKEQKLGISATDRVGKVLKGIADKKKSNPQPLGNYKPN